MRLPQNASNQRQVEMTFPAHVWTTRTRPLLTHEDSYIRAMASWVYYTALYMPETDNLPVLGTRDELSTLCGYNV